MGCKAHRRPRSSRVKRAAMPAAESVPHATVNVLRGGGDACLNTAILLDDKATKADVALVSRAVRERWPGLQEKAESVVSRLMGIVQKEAVLVPIGDGIGPSEGEADRNATAAARVLASMMAQQQRDEHAKNGAGGRQTTINVGVNVDARIDEQRDRTLAIAQRFRAGSVLERASS